MYVKFVDSLLRSRKPEVAFIANMAVSDNRTVMGKTMASLVKTKLKYFPVPQVEEWRLSFLDELLSVEKGEWSIDDFFSSSNVKGMISSLKF